MVSSNTMRVLVVLLAVLVCAAVVGYAAFQFWSPGDQSGGSATNGTRAVTSLKYVIVVARHGNRRLYTYPNDPYPPSNKALWPYPMGALTVQGRVQMYNLGLKLRALYNGFLDKYYWSDEFYATSTPYERVVQSGQAILAGLYPPVDFEIWNKDILWQPIPVYEDSPDKLPVFDAGTCPRLVQAQHEGEQNIAPYTSNFTAVSDYLNPYTGENLTAVDAFFQVWDACISEDTERLTLPEWVKPVYPEPMTTLAGLMYIVVSGIPEMSIRFTVGPMVQQMMELMQSKANGTLSPDRLMQLYSSHDATMVSLQGALGFSQSSMIGLVKPGSAMVFELHENTTTNEFYVELLYIDGGNLDLEPRFLNIPGCSQPCSLNRLVEITYRFSNITNYWEECQLNYTTDALLHS